MKWIYYFFLFICLNSFLVSAQCKIERWGRYELSIPAKLKGNPFEVRISATFTHADRKVTVEGFYDGNDTFKVRFMPDRQGVWNYVTHSEETLLNNRKGTFECVEASKNNHGPVQVEECNFKYADGKYYYPVGTTSYDWMHVAENLQKQTICSISEAGFNKIRMLFFVQNFDEDYPEPELFPFEIKKIERNENGKLVYEWDYNRFNPEYFRHVENCIDSLKNIGVEADLILFHPYDDGRWNFDKLPLSVCERYLKYLVFRLSSFRNVWWSLANEYDFLKFYSAKDWDFFTKVVIENDPYRHLCSIHSYTAKYYAYWKPEYTHASIQDQAPLQLGAAGIVKNIYKKPIVFDEVCYEGNMNNRWGNLSGQEYIYRLWMGITAGTYVTHGECYMNSATDYSKNFLAVGGCFQGEAWKRIAFVRSILDSLPQPLRHCDPSWDLRTASAGENYYMIYLGKEIANDWLFELPEKNIGYNSLKEGTCFKVEIIDTWNMTITEYPQIFETTKAYNKRVFDKEHKKVLLPSVPYLLLRITAVE